LSPAWIVSCFSDVTPVPPPNNSAPSGRTIEIGRPESLSTPTSGLGTAGVDPTGGTGVPADDDDDGSGREAEPSEAAPVTCLLAADRAVLVAPGYVTHLCLLRECSS
jgi:hypothetical protein